MLCLFVRVWFWSHICNYAVGVICKEREPHASFVADTKNLDVGVPYLEHVRDGGVEGREPSVKRRGRECRALGRE